MCCLWPSCSFRAKYLGITKPTVWCWVLIEQDWTGKNGTGKGRNLITIGWVFIILIIFLASLRGNRKRKNNLKGNIREAWGINLFIHISERKSITKHNVVTKTVRENYIVYVEDKMQTLGLGFDHVSFGINSSFDDTDKNWNVRRHKIFSAMKYFLVMTADFLWLLIGMLLKISLTLSFKSSLKYWT